MSSKSVDEILETLVNICFENAYEAVNNKQSFNNFPYITRAKAHLYQLIKDRVIEEDEDASTFEDGSAGEVYRNLAAFAHNELRASQRKALQELFEVKDDE